MTVYVDDFIEAEDGDDSPAFNRAIAYINPDNSVYTQASDTIQLLSRTYVLSEPLRLHSGICVRGTSKAALVRQPASTLHFSAKSGTHMLGSRGYDRGVGGGYLENLTVKSTAIDSDPFPVDTAVSVGELFHIPKDREFLYECVTAGTTDAVPGGGYQPMGAFGVAEDFKWQAETVYPYNVVVWVEGDSDYVYWHGPTQSTAEEETSGTTAPTFTDPNDGSIEWVPVPAAAHIVVSGTAVFIPLQYPGVAYDSQSEVRGCYFVDASGPAVSINASGGQKPARNANYAKVIDCYHHGCHGFVKIRGEDANSCTVSNCSFFGNPEDDSDFGYWDGSLSGCKFYDCTAEASGGPPFKVTAAGGKTIIVGGHTESFVDSEIVFAYSIGCAGLTVTPGSRVLDPTTGTGVFGKDAPAGTMTELTNPNSPGTVLSLNHSSEPQRMCLTHTSAIGSLPEHCYAWAYEPGVYGKVFAPQVLTSEGAPPWKEDTVGAGHSWFPRNKIFIGPRRSMTIGEASVDLGPCCIAYMAELPNSGAWGKGDLIYFTEGTDKQALCTASGKYGSSIEPEWDVT